jgi:hypothetical protein
VYLTTATQAFLARFDPLNRLNPEVLEGVEPVLEYERRASLPWSREGLRCLSQFCMCRSAAIGPEQGRPRATRISHDTASHMSFAIA